MPVQRGDLEPPPHVPTLVATVIDLRPSGASRLGRILWRHTCAAYVDGFNLYYGGKALAEADGFWAGSLVGWIDLGALIAGVMHERWSGRNPVLRHVTYCTARVVGKQPPLPGGRLPARSSSPGAQTLATERALPVAALDD